MAAVNRIPPLSESTSLLMAQLMDPDHSLADIVAIVDRDPVLTMQVLKIANSAALARRASVTSVAEAVAYLGDKTVTGIALSLCAGDLLDQDLPGYMCKRGTLWRHSLTAAIAARELAGCSEHVVTSGTAYTAALLHDIGKAVLSAFTDGGDIMGDSFTAASDSVDFLAVERDALGIDHADVGALLCVHWRMPQVLVQAVRFHHRPAESRAGSRALCYLVHLADHAAMSIGA
ncbi:MAG: HDOD domain-containing protein, partial [Planctomycetota bacterium]